MVASTNGPSCYIKPLVTYSAIWIDLKEPVLLFAQSALARSRQIYHIMSVSEAYLLRVFGQVNCRNLEDKRKLSTHRGSGSSGEHNHRISLGKASPTPPEGSKP